MTSSKQIKTFLVAQTRVPELDDDQDIFHAGYVNSLFALKLVMFLEKEFGITIDDDDLELDNFRSVNAMTGLVEKKLNRQTQNMAA